MSNSTTSDSISQQRISLPEWLEHVEGFSKSKMTKEMVREALERVCGG